MSSQLEQARLAVASEIGPDIGEFTPPEEKHFFGEAAMLSLAGSFLIGFFGGFAKAAGEKSGEKLAGTLVDFIAKRLHAERGKSPEEQSKSLEAAAAEARRTQLTPEMRLAISDAVEKALAAALAQEAEPDIAQRIAARVREEAMPLALAKEA